MGFKRGKRFLWFLSNSIDYSTNLKTPFQYYESEKRNEEEINGIFIGLIILMVIVLLAYWLLV